MAMGMAQTIPGWIKEQIREHGSTLFLSETPSAIQPEISADLEKKMTTTKRRTNKQKQIMDK